LQRIRCAQHEQREGVVVRPGVIAHWPHSLEDDGWRSAPDWKRHNRWAESRSTRTTEIARPESMGVAEYSLSGAVDVTRVVPFTAMS